MFFFVFPLSLLRYQNISPQFRKHQVFGNAPHQSSILYLNFLRDERLHAVRHMSALVKRQQNPSSVNFYCSIKPKVNIMIA